MDDALPATPAYRHTMDRLEAARHEASTGPTFWLAREIQPILGYSTWEAFTGVMSRATAASSRTASSRPIIFERRRS